jgi:peptidoglycan/LPS O-acetylase OafA/YrhL
MKESGNLDFLRACAVLLVLVGHTLSFYGVQQIGSFQVTGLGQAGVSFFFVHTCLVLMMSLERLTRFGHTGLFGSFYLRRFFRIYPLSIVFVISAAVLQLPSGDLSKGVVHAVKWSTGDLFSNLLLIQNLTHSKDILSVLWSLPLEVQMYLFLPPLFLALGRWGGTWSLLTLWCAAVGVALLQPYVSARLNLAQFAPSFLPGVIAYALSNRIRPFLPSWLWLIWVPGLSVLNFAPVDKKPEWLVCLALGLSIPLFREISLPALRRVSFWIAKYSYGEYLCHVMCLWFAFQYLGHFPLAAQWSIFVLLVTGIPVLVFHTIEAPMIRMGSRLADKWFHKPVSQDPVVFASGESISCANHPAN